MWWYNYIDNDFFYYLFFRKKVWDMIYIYKKFGVVFFVLLLIVVLVVCGNNLESKGFFFDLKDEEIIIYKVENGNVKIFKYFKWVVVMVDGYYGYFKILGINVVGVFENVFKNFYYKGKIDGVINIGDGMFVEKVIDLNFDLIIVWIM